MQRNPSALYSPIPVCLPHATSSILLGLFFFVGSTVGISLLSYAFTVVMSCYSAPSLAPLYQVTHGEDPHALSEVTISEGRIWKGTLLTHGWLEHPRVSDLPAVLLCREDHRIHSCTFFSPCKASGSLEATTELFRRSCNVHIPTPHPHAQRAKSKIRVSSSCHIYDALEKGSLLRESGAQFPAHLSS